MSGGGARLQLPPREGRGRDGAQRQPTRKERSRKILPGPGRGAVSRDLLPRSLSERHFSVTPPSGSTGQPHRQKSGRWLSREAHPHGCMRRSSVCVCGGGIVIDRLLGRTPYLPPFPRRLRSRFTPASTLRCESHSFSQPSSSFIRSLSHPLALSDVSRLCCLLSLSLFFFYVRGALPLSAPQSPVHFITRHFKVSAKRGSQPGIERLPRRSPLISSVKVIQEAN